MLRTPHRSNPTRLRREVVNRLAESVHLTGARIEISASAGGIVTLTGTVRSAAQRWRAASTAWTAPGVEEVINLLSIDG